MMILPDCYANACDYYTDYTVKHTVLIIAATCSSLPKALLEGRFSETLKAMTSQSEVRLQLFIKRPLTGLILSHFVSRGQLGTRLLRHTAADPYLSISFHTFPHLSILIYSHFQRWQRVAPAPSILGARCLCGSPGGSALNTHAGDET